MAKQGNLDNFHLFLDFMKGDTSISDALYWSLSIVSKEQAMFILQSEVLQQIPKCHGELNILNSQKFTSGIEFAKLAIKYEVFLNSIYCLCENLSVVVRHLKRQANLPNGFNRQKTKFLKNKTIDPTYSSLLASTSWYDEVHAMRTEATHYLSGMVVFPSPDELGYINTPKNTRKDAPQKIEIPNIEQHVKSIFDSVIDFLVSFGNHFITLLNPRNKIHQICFYLPDKQLLCAKIISLDAILKGESGLCLTVDVECPNQQNCEAHKLARTIKKQV